MTTKVMRLEKTCASQDFSTLRALPCDQSQTQKVENRHQSPRESATDSCQRSFAREEGKKSDSFSGLRRSGHRCIASISCSGTLGGRFSTWGRGEHKKKPLEISPPGASVPHLTTSPLSSRCPVRGSGRTVGKSRGHRPCFGRSQAKKSGRECRPSTRGRMRRRCWLPSNTTFFNQPAGPWASFTNCQKNGGVP